MMFEKSRRHVDRDNREGESWNSEISGTEWMEIIVVNDCAKSLCAVNNSTLFT